MVFIFLRVFLDVWGEDWLEVSMWLGYIGKGDVEVVGIGYRKWDLF